MASELCVRSAFAVSDAGPVSVVLVAPTLCEHTDCSRLPGTELKNHPVAEQHGPPPGTVTSTTGAFQGLKSEILSSNVKPSQIVLPPGIAPSPPYPTTWPRGNFLILFDRTVDLPLDSEVIFNLNHTQGNDAIISPSRLNGSSLFVFEYNLSPHSKLFWPSGVIS